MLPASLLRVDDARCGVRRRLRAIAIFFPRTIPRRGTRDDRARAAKTARRCKVVDDARERGGEIIGSLIAQRRFNPRIR